VFVEAPEVKASDQYLSVPSSPFKCDPTRTLVCSFMILINYCCRRVGPTADNPGNLCSLNIETYTSINRESFVNFMLIRFDDSAVGLQRAITDVKQRWSVIGWGTKNLLSRVPPCFGRHVNPFVPAAFAVVSTHQSALGPVLLLCIP
jgi:hypothetical protein